MAVAWVYLPRSPPDLPQRALGRYGPARALRENKLPEGAGKFNFAVHRARIASSLYLTCGHSVSKTL